MVLYTLDVIAILFYFYFILFDSFISFHFSFILFIVLYPGVIGNYLLYPDVLGN